MNAAVLHQTAHALKGASAEVGARGIVEIAQHLEDLARSQSVAGAEALLGLLEEEFSRARFAVEQLLNGETS